MQKITKIELLCIQHVWKNNLVVYSFYFFAKLLILAQIILGNQMKDTVISNLCLSLNVCLCFSACLSLSLSFFFACLSLSLSLTPNLLCLCLSQSLYVFLSISITLSPTLWVFTVCLSLSLYISLCRSILLSIFLFPLLSLTLWVSLCSSYLSVSLSLSPVSLLYTMQSQQTLNSVHSYLFITIIQRMYLQRMIKV